ncbi:MAG TPA: UMP kinase, partial [Clostridia bacterium]|nr:UMP kinase [Clostridia bacterium]
MAYRRVLIKLSGEALGLDGKLFDFAQIDRVAGVLAQLAREGLEIGVVIGAGNIWRGRQGPAARMDAVTADHMGMLG